MAEQLGRLSLEKGCRYYITLRSGVVYLDHDGDVFYWSGGGVVKLPLVVKCLCAYRDGTFLGLNYASAVYRETDLITLIRYCPLRGLIYYWDFVNPMKRCCYKPDYFISYRQGQITLWPCCNTDMLQYPIQLDPFQLDCLPTTWAPTYALAMKQPPTREQMEGMICPPASGGESVQVAHGYRLCWAMRRAKHIDFQLYRLPPWSPLRHRHFEQDDRRRIYTLYLLRCRNSCWGKLPLDMMMLLGRLCLQYD